MNQFQSRHNDLKQLIDVRSKEIVDMIRGGEFATTETLISKRYDYITELVSLVSTDDDKRIILQYISEFQLCDLAIAKIIQNEQNSLKKALSNNNKMKEY